MTELNLRDKQLLYALLYRIQEHCIPFEGGTTTDESLIISFDQATYSHFLNIQKKLKAEILKEEDEQLCTK